MHLRWPVPRPIHLLALSLSLTFGLAASAETTIETGGTTTASYSAETPAVVSFVGKQGDYARVEVLQTRGDARVEARTTDGRFLRSINQNPATETELIEIVLPEDCTAEVEISAARGNKEGGEAKVVLSELRPATETERTRVGADMALEDGDQLMRAGSADALHEAVARYETARTLYEKSGNRKMVGVALDASGWVHDLLGEKRKAIEIYEQALAVRREVGDKDGEIFTLLGIGLIYAYLGENDKALDLDQYALGLTRETGNKEHEANLLHNIAALYWATDEMQKALEYYRQSLEIRRAIDDRYGEAGTLNNIGDVYRRLGDLDRAMEYFQRALEIRTEFGNKRGMAHSLHTMGLVYAARGEWTTARDTFQRGLDLRRETGDKRGIAFSLSGLAGAYHALGQDEKAIEYAREAIELWKEMGETRSLGETRWRLGLMLVDQGRLDEAKEAFDEAIEIAKRVRDRTSEASARYGLARYDRAKGDLEASKENIEAAIEIVESLRGKIASEELRASYLASVSGFYEFYISLQMELDRKKPDSGFAARALETSERARARSLLESLSAASVETELETGTPLATKERELRQQISRLDKQVIKLAAEESQTTELALAQTKLDQTLAEYQSTLDEIREKNPRLSALMRPKALSLKEIQSLLDDGTALLEFSLGEDESFVWVVTSGGIASASLPSRSEIDTRSRALYESLVSRNEMPDGESLRERRDRIDRADSVWKTTAVELSRILLDPVLDSISGRRLVVVADGALQYLPFSALPDPASKDQAPLLVAREVVVLPSASLLPLLRADRNGRKGGTTEVSIVADPVFQAGDPRVEHRSEDVEIAPAEEDPNRLLFRSAAEVGMTSFPRLRFSRREAESITSFLEPGKSILATDFDANLESIDWKAFGASRVIHFATHGILNSRNPELSGLVLSLVDRSGRPRAGFLKLGDIYALDLDADLVVLSACQTALGKEIRGEGLIGLTRGFMYSGAPRVISSLWRVDDRATSELMKRVYQNLLQQHERPAAALRKAQLELRSKEQWSAPYYWAAFTIQGDWQ